jgi:hypothetical protein
MNPQVQSIAAVTGTTLDLRFADGQLRRFDVQPYIDRGGVFAQLQMPAIFQSARVVAGAIEWPGEIDLSHDTLYLRSVPLDERPTTTQR